MLYEVITPLYDEIPLSQEVRVDNGEVGSIMTNGQDAQGILVYAGDVQILNGGVIETREAYSAGIVITSYSIHYTKLYEERRMKTGSARYRASTTRMSLMYGRSGSKKQVLNWYVGGITFRLLRCAC